MTQNDMILDYLKTHTGINPAQAEELFACRRLAARIKDLKERGYTILSLRRKGFNKFGKPCRFSEYRLLKESENEKS